MRKKISFAAVVLLAHISVLEAAEYHVATLGKDSNDGRHDTPFRTIQRASDIAQAGDLIVVHSGVYRERVNPPRGGESDSKRIVYQAAAGEKVAIKGSEEVKGWTKLKNDTWQVVLPNSFFGSYNPYSELIKGDWFDAQKREHHTGAVYLDGHWLIEAAKRDEVLEPVAEKAFWYAKVDDANTTIWAQFKDVDPNKRLVEVNVRKTVFYPDKVGRDFITVRGFTLCHAATQWAPPTSEQTAVIGSNWSKGWVIENNIVSHSICSGISLGKHGDKFDNTSADSAEGYVKTIERAHAFEIPWTKETIGNHIVRNNHISHCEQAGIVGSMGCAFSTVIGNEIHDIHVRELFSGAEMAGIKFHGAIDVTLANNHIHHCNRGLWLDWMAQGTRVTGNLFNDNMVEDVYMEVNHGPYLIDNNIFLSSLSVRDLSEGGAYVHNLFAGTIICATEPDRKTPFHPAHSTKISGLPGITGGDNRFYNNLFIANNDPIPKDRMSGGKRKGMRGHGLWVYNEREFPLHTAENVYVNGAKPYMNEINPLIVSEGKFIVASADTGAKIVLHINLDQVWIQAKSKLVTTESLGKAKISSLPYVNPDDTALKIDKDYFGKVRNPDSPSPGPFENPGTGDLQIKTWRSN